MQQAKETLEKEKENIMAKNTGLEEELKVKQEVLKETRVCECMHV